MIIIFPYVSFIFSVLLINFIHNNITDNIITILGIHPYCANIDKNPYELSIKSKGVVSLEFFLGSLTVPNNSAVCISSFLPIPYSCSNIRIFLYMHCYLISSCTYQYYWNYPKYNYIFNFLSF